MPAIKIGKNPWPKEFVFMWNKKEKEKRLLSQPDYDTQVLYARHEIKKRKVCYALSCFMEA